MSHSKNSYSRVSQSKLKHAKLLDTMDIKRLASLIELKKSALPCSDAEFNILIVFSRKLQHFFWKWIHQEECQTISIPSIDNFWREYSFESCLRHAGSSFIRYQIFRGKMLSTIRGPIINKIKRLYMYLNDGNHIPDDLCSSLKREIDLSKRRLAGQQQAKVAQPIIMPLLCIITSWLVQQDQEETLESALLFMIVFRAGYSTVATSRVKYSDIDILQQVINGKQTDVLKISMCEQNIGNVESFACHIDDETEDLGLLRLLFLYVGKKLGLEVSLSNWVNVKNALNKSYIFQNRSKLYWSRKFRSLNIKFLPSVKLSLHASIRSAVSNICLNYGSTINGEEQSKTCSVLCVTRNLEYIEDIQGDIRLKSHAYDDENECYVAVDYLTSVNGFYHTNIKDKDYWRSYKEFLLRLGIEWDTK